MRVPRRRFVALHERGAESRELRAHGGRLENVDVLTPSSEAAGKHDLVGRTDSHLRAVFVDRSVGHCQLAELVTQERHDRGTRDHDRGCALALLVHVAHDVVPCPCEVEVIRAVGGLICDHCPDDPLDAKCALGAIHAAEQVPHLVLLDQTPRVTESFDWVAVPTPVAQAHLHSLYDSGL